MARRRKAFQTVRQPERGSIGTSVGWCFPDGCPDQGSTQTDALPLAGPGVAQAHLRKWRTHSSRQPQHSQHSRCIRTNKSARPGNRAANPGRTIRSWVVAQALAWSFCSHIPNPKSNQTAILALQFGVSSAPHADRIHGSHRKSACLLRAFLPPTAMWYACRQR